MVPGMAMKKVTVTMPDWLHPYVADAAQRRSVSVSEWLSRAAQIELYREEGRARQAADAAAGIDRAAVTEADERAMLADRDRRVQGAA